MSPAVKLSSESCEVVVGVTLETHHLTQETRTPGFRRLLLLLRHSLFQKTEDAFCVRCPLHHCAQQVGLRTQ